MGGFNCNNVVETINLICCAFTPRYFSSSASLRAPPPTRCLPSLTRTHWWPVTWWMAATPSWLWPGTSTWSSAHWGGPSGVPCACWWSCTTRARTASSTPAMSVNTMWRPASIALSARWEPGVKLVHEICTVKRFTSSECTLPGKARFKSLHDFQTVLSFISLCIKKRLFSYEINVVFDPHSL